MIAYVFQEETLKIQIRIFFSFLNPLLPRICCHTYLMPIVSKSPFALIASTVYSSSLE